MVKKQLIKPSVNYLIVYSLLVLSVIVSNNKRVI